MQLKGRSPVCLGCGGESRAGGAVGREGVVARLARSRGELGNRRTSLCGNLRVTHRAHNSELIDFHRGAQEPRRSGSRRRTFELIAANAVDGQGHAGWGWRRPRSATRRGTLKPPGALS